MKNDNLFYLTMLRLCVSAVVFALAIAMTLPVEAQRHRSNHHAKQTREMQAQQRMMQTVERQMVAREKMFENNVRSFVLLFGDEEVRKKISVTKKQKEKLDDLEKKYEAARVKLIRPNGSKFENREQARAAVEKNQDKLQELSLQCGKAIMEVLDVQQINEYGRHVTAERAEKIWERKLGIEPEKPERKEKELEKKPIKK